MNQPQWLAMLDAYPAVLGDVLNLFELSPYFSEQLVRRFEFLSELMAMRNPVETHLPYTDLVSVLEEPADLRTFYHRELFRILAESLSLDRPIFDTLHRCSELADAAIQTTYRIAIADTLAKQGPTSPRYEPRDQMMVIAMGRLGMLEFDLGSDADLLFVLSPRDAEEIPFWRTVAQRMINLLSSYTADGIIFAVDTRLRPDGSSGSLVQTEESYRGYFESRAEAWEGLAFMKSRAVAGDGPGPAEAAVCTFDGGFCPIGCGWGQSCPGCCGGRCGSGGVCASGFAGCTGSGCACTVGQAFACGVGLACCSTTGTAFSAGTCQFFCPYA